MAKVALEDLHRRLDSVDSAVLPHTNNQNTIIDRVAEVIRNLTLLWLLKLIFTQIVAW